MNKIVEWKNQKSKLKIEIKIVKLQKIAYKISNEKLQIKIKAKTKNKNQ